ncbi:unnamed protein product [Adineta ricciae]|uniref:Uncharacterized protein n=1 Tax=Adineta ricciae TaxID=249248 RepID=A0A814G1Z7_ADIRI|nr:unnamed protein product [Adineta ricciae]CAF0990607.1 unnamed protein product [Adineta ricciae]
MKIKLIKLLDQVNFPRETRLYPTNVQPNKLQIKSKNERSYDDGYNLVGAPMRACSAGRLMRFVPEHSMHRGKSITQKFY